MTEQEVRETLGANIRKQRKRLSLSQECLAAELDIATNFLSDIENGKKWISPGTLAKLTEALELDAHELFTRENKLPLEVCDLLREYTATLAKVEKSLGELRDTTPNELEAQKEVKVRRIRDSLIKVIEEHLTLILRRYI
jgi:transcriptional regulator with XRE-family HTH domain